jgi:hypothetical protein
MRLFLLLPIVAATTFLLGRATDPAPAVGAARTHISTGRLYDVFRVPGAALRCEVGKAAGSLSVSCEHTPYAQARHEVLFSKDNMLVYRLGRPDKPVWSARGSP